jgi:hypothetical protein
VIPCSAEMRAEAGVGRCAQREYRLWVGIRIALHVGFGGTWPGTGWGQSGCGHVRESGWAWFSKNDQAGSVKRGGPCFEIEISASPLSHNHSTPFDCSVSLSSLFILDPGGGGAPAGGLVTPAAPLYQGMLWSAWTAAPACGEARPSRGGATSSGGTSVASRQAPAGLQPAMVPVLVPRGGCGSACGGRARIWWSSLLHRAMAAWI